MAIYEWIWIAMMLAFYGVPFIVGLSVSTLRKAVLVAIASFAGLYASIWSTLGPLILPLAAQLVTRYEQSAILLLSFLLGALQATVIAAAGFGLKRLVGRIINRFPHQGASQAAA